MTDLFDGLIFDPAIFDTLPVIEPSGTSPSYLVSGLGFATTRLETPFSQSTVEVVISYLQAKAAFAMSGNLAAYNATLEAILNE